MADIVNGCGDGTFRPENNVTRAQFIMMLYNMGGRPAVSDTSLAFAERGTYIDGLRCGRKVGAQEPYHHGLRRQYLQAG